MFGLFKKSKPQSALDMLIIQMYGSLDHKKTADLEAATQIAFDNLLCQMINLDLVRLKASELYAGPIPYSTNDLALSVALAFFKDPSCHDNLLQAQMVARMQVLDWIMDGVICKPLAVAFENTLYKIFKP
jgi:hypothetical protein